MWKNKKKTARTTGKRTSVGGTTEGLEVGRKTLSTPSVVRGLVRWLVAFDKNVPVEKGGQPCRRKKQPACRVSESRLSQAIVV